MPHKRANHSTCKADRLNKGHDLAPSYKPSSRTSDPHFNAVPKGAARIINGLRVQQEYRARKKLEEDRAAGIIATTKNSETSTAAGTGSEKAGAAATAKTKSDAKGKGKGKGKDTSDDPSHGLKIRPGEKLRDFNSRVEQAFAPKVLSAARSVGRAGKRKRRAEAAAAALAKEQEEKSKNQSAEQGSGSWKRRSEKNKGDLKWEREQLEAQMANRSDQGALDFAKLEQRKRVGDVVQAPPRLTTAPRGEGEEAKKRKLLIRKVLGGGGDEGGDGTINKVRLPDPVRKRDKEGEGEGTSKVVLGGLKRKADLEEERDRALKAYRRLKGRD